MNIIAAVIFPLDDETLARKFEPHSNELLLTKVQRVRLWRGHLGRADDFWVYDDSENSWREFQGRLVQAAFA
jgi:hypothetical protein